MDWYFVVKTIKGRRYYYRQRTWREGKRVRTHSEYVGPADPCFVAFHGTFAKFDSFSREALGSNTAADDAREGFFFASNELVAVSYASTYLAASRGLGSAQGQLEERIQQLTGLNSWDAKDKLLEGAYKADLKLENKLKSYLERLERARGRLNDLAQRGIFKKLELASSASLKVQRLSIRKPYVYDMEGSGYSEYKYMDAIEEARSRGCDGVIIKNTRDGLTPSFVWPGGREAKTTVYIVFHERQILPFD
jgi:hypothetical protein